MHIDVPTLTALAVFLHLGTGLASSRAHTQAERAKIDKIDAGLDQVLGAVTAVAQALNAAAPPAPNAGGAGQGGANTKNGGDSHAG